MRSVRELIVGESIIDVKGLFDELRKFYIDHKI